MLRPMFLDFPEDKACDTLDRQYMFGDSLLVAPIFKENGEVAHVKGTPMLRPMFLDFPEDKACDTLDRQYMFGDSLLVAPIFKENGEVQYYLPEGTWYNLITGLKVEGGKWQKETHDYHSLPLMVRPNTILPMGNNEVDAAYDFADGVTLVLSEFGKWQKETHDYHSLPLMVRPNTILPMGNNEVDAAYDFADGVTLVLSEFADGAEANIEIPDVKGEIVMNVHAVRHGGEILLTIKGGNGNFSVKNLGSGKVIVK